MINSRLFPNIIHRLINEDFVTQNTNFFSTDGIRINGGLNLTQQEIWNAQTRIEEVYWEEHWQYIRVFPVAMRIISMMGYW